MFFHQPALARLGLCLVCAIAAGIWPSEGRAAVDTATARYSLDTCTLEISAPVEVGRAKGHFWFPSLHMLTARDVICEAVLADDKAQGKWPAALCLSQDGGASWTRTLDIDCYGPISAPLGAGKILMMPYETWPLTPNDKRNAKAEGTVVALTQDGKLTAERTPVTYSGFPRDLADYHVGELYLLTNGNILPLADGRLLATVYGKFAGDTKDSNWAVTSSDRGFTWKYQATVANGMQLKTAEGANESNNVRLADGRLMSIFRTGREYHKSYSSDEGMSWTDPEMMRNVYAVEPQLVRLGNGVMLISGGREPLLVWACTDREGKTWNSINLAEHHSRLVSDASLRYSTAYCQDAGVNPTQSTCYTGMAPVGPDEVLVCYDRLGNGWKGAPGPNGQWDVVFCVRIKATRK